MQVGSSDIIGLTETWVTSEVNYVPGLAHYKIFCSPAEKTALKGRPKGGIILAVNPKIYCTSILDISEYFIFIRISKQNFNSIIGICYCSPLANFDVFLNKLNFALMHWVVKFPNDLIILGGDFNARIGILNQLDPESIQNNTAFFPDRSTLDNVINKRGSLLVENLEKYGLIALNGRSGSDHPAQFTYCGAPGRSVNDLAWCNINQLQELINFEIKFIISNSDHFPIQITLRNLDIVKNNSKVLRYCWDPDKVTSFQNKLTDSIKDINIEHLDVDRASSSIINCIYDAASLKKMYSNDKAFNKKVTNKPWYNKDCKIAKHKCSDSLKICKKINFEEKHRVIYLSRKKDYKSLIKKNRIEYERNIVQELSQTRDPGSFWKIVNRYRGKSFLMDHIKVEVLWYDYLQKNFKKKNESFQVQISPSSDDILDQPISLKELDVSLVNCKNGKAAGPDEISYEFWKNLPQLAKNYLLQLFNKVFLEESRTPKSWSKVLLKMLHKKGDSNSPENYRPIALINTIAKVFTSILNYRLKKFVKFRNVLPEAQSGFREGRSCLDNIFILSSLIQLKLRQKNRKLFALFVDFKEAFPSVQHQLLWYKLKKLGLSSKFINVLKDLYDKAEVKINNVNGDTPYVKVTKDLLQGEITSPLLFSLFIADLEAYLKERGVRGTQINHLTEVIMLAFADDLIFFADNYVDMKKILKNLEDYCKENNLIVNVNKTKIIIFQKGGSLNINNYIFLYENAEIDIVKSYRYLGIEFFNTGLFNNTTNLIVGKSCIASGATLSTIYKMKDITWQTCLKLYNSLVSSVTLYSAVVWSIRYLENIEKVQLCFFKSLLNLPLNTPDCVLRLETGNSPIALVVFKLTLKWIIKLINMENFRYPKICFLKLKDLAQRFPTNNDKYNWISQINTNFFKKINIDIDIFCKSNKGVTYQKHLLDKLKRAFILKDIEKTQKLNYLYFQDSLNYELAQPRYFNLVNNIKLIKVIAQVRLSNKYNERIIVKNLLYKTGSDYYCTYCNSSFNIAHIMKECILFHDLRKKYFKDYSLFTNEIKCVNGGNIKAIGCFISEALERYKLFM